MKSRANSQLALPPMPLNSIDDVRPRTDADVGSGQSPSIRLTEIVKDALQRHYGSLKAAALSMTPPMDQAQLTRELQSGDLKFEKLDRLDRDGQASVAKALHNGLDETDPRVQAQRLIREARARLDELADVVAERRSA